MKNNSRRLFAVLFLIFSLFFLVGCLDTSYSIILDEEITVDVENPLKINKGTLVTVTVTLPEGKEIDKLLINGEEVIIEGNTYSFNITGRTKVSVTFKDIDIYYSLELNEGITTDVSNLNKILKNTEVTLNFNVPENKEIDKLLLNGEEIILTNESYSFFINENTTATLVLKDKLEVYSLTLGEGITSNITNLNNIAKNTLVTLTFNVPENKEIDKLLINGTEVTLTNDSYSFNITENTTASLVLKDKLEYYSLTLGEGLTANISNLDNILNDTLVTLTFNIPENKEIDKLLINGTEVTLTNDSYSFNINENTTASLVLKDKLVYYSLTLGEGLSSSISNLNNILEDTEVVVDVIVPIGKLLNHIIVNGENITLQNNKYTFNITKDTVISAVFDDVYFSLTLPEGVTSNLTNLNAIKYNSEVSLTVEVVEGYAVSEFLVNNELKELTNLTYTFNITSNTVINVSFIHLNYKLTLSDNLSADITNLDNINYGTSIKITVNIPVDKELKHLLVNNEVVNIVGNEYEFTMTKDTVINALLNTFYSLTLPEFVSSNLSNLDSIYENTLVLLTVNKPENKAVSSFKVNGIEVSLINNTYEFFINSDTTVLVEFVNVYKLTLPEFVTANVVDLNNIIEDTLVELSVNLAVNQELKYFKVNDTLVTLTNNKYEFNILKDTVVTIDFTTYYSLTLAEGLTANVSDLEKIISGTEVILTLNLPSEKHLNTLYINEKAVNNFSNYYKFKMSEDSNVTFTYYDEALLVDIINFILNVDKTFINEGVFNILKYDYSYDDKEALELIFDLDKDLNIVKGIIAQSEIYGLTNYIYNMYFDDQLMYYEFFRYENETLEDYDTDYQLSFYQSDILEMILASSMFNSYDFIPSGPFSFNDFIYQLIDQYSLILKDKVENNLVDNIKFYQQDNDMIVVYKANSNDILSLVSMFMSLDIEELEDIDETELFLEIEFLFTNNKFVNLKISFTNDIDNLEEYSEFYIGYYGNEVILPEEFYELDINELDGVVYYFHYDEDKVVEVSFPDDEYIDFYYLNPYKKGYSVEGFYTDSDFLTPLTGEDLVDGLHIYIKWQAVKTVEELIDNFINDGLFILYNHESYSLYMESDKYIYYQNNNEELFAYDKLNDDYYRFRLVNDEFVAVIVPHNSFTLLSIMSYLTDDVYFKGEIKGAYFDLELLTMIEENGMFISINAPFGVASGRYVSESVASLEEFNMVLDNAINNAIEDEIEGLEFYYQHHFYDINSVEDDVLFYIIYNSGRYEVVSLKGLKEEFNMLDYILPNENNNYKLIIIIGENEVVMDEFVFFDGNRGKILVYNDVFYYLDELDELPEISVGEFETLINYKVNKFYFNTLEELKNYQTTDKVLVLEKGKVEIISFAGLLDIFSSYKYVVIENDEFIAHYDFNLNIFYVVKYNGLKMQFEFNDNEVIFISEDIKVILPNDHFHKDSFVETFIDNWEYRFIYYHLYTIYYELNNNAPRKYYDIYIFDNMELNFGYGDLIVITTDNYWINSIISFTDEELYLEFNEDYQFELTINSNVIEPIYYYTNYPHFEYYYHLNNYYLTGLFKYDEFGEVDFDSHFYGNEFYQQNKIEVYALYDRLEDISYYLDYYKSFDQYILTDKFSSLLIKVDVNKGIEFYNVYGEEEFIFGYIDLSTGNKYRILDNKLYLTEDALLFNYVEFFNEAELDRFNQTSGFRYSYYDDYYDIYIYAINYDLEIYFHYLHYNFHFEFIEAEFTNFDFSNYETAIEEPVDFELLDRGISSFDNYEHEVEFNVIYNNGLTKYLTLYQIKKEYPVEVIFEKYQTTITITLDELDFIFILDDENNFVYDERYGFLFIFEGSEVIYKDDLIARGSLPTFSQTDDIYEFSNWMINGEIIFDLEDLLFKSEDYYRFVYLEPKFGLASYSKIVDMFNSYEYIVLSNYEYNAYYNFKENYFYIDSNQGLMFVSFNDEKMIYTTREEKYIIPIEKFNYESFIDQIYFYYNETMFIDIYTIYYELNNITPILDEFSYRFDRLSLDLYYDMLYLYVRNGFWQDSILTFTNEEPSFEVEYTYERELIIDNNISSTIYYYANEWNYFEYLFLNSYLEDYYNYDENMDVDYDNPFYMWELYEYLNVRIYANYELFKEVDYYIDYYKSLDKYILIDMYNGYSYKINGNESIDIYFYGDIFGFINLLTNEKYIVKENTLYLTDYSILFNFREFFNNANVEDFINYGNSYSYYLAEEGVSFYIAAMDYSLDLYHHNYWINQHLELFVEDFDSYDFSGYDYGVEEVVDIKLLNRREVLTTEEFSHILIFELTYNTGLIKEFTYADLYSMFYVISEHEKYETIISIFADGSLFTINLRDNYLFVYDSSYGVLFSFDWSFYMYQDDLAQLNELPIIEVEDYYLEGNEFYYYGELVTIEYLTDEEIFNYGIYFLEVNYKLKEFDSLKESFKNASYIIFYGSAFTAYYNYNLNSFYATNPWQDFYISFNEDEFIYQDANKRVIIPTDRFNAYSFKDDVIEQWAVGMIFEYLYTIYSSFNGEVIEKTYNVIYFPNMRIEHRYDGLYTYFDNGWDSMTYIELSDEEIVLDEFLELTYSYALIINNEITDEIYYHTNTKDIYFYYEFLYSYFIALYNYNIELEVDFDSIFDPSQFNDSNIIEVFGLYASPS